MHYKEFYMKSVVIIWIDRKYFKNQNGESDSLK